MTHCDPYPTQSRAERIADAVLHILGVTFAVAGSIILIILALGRVDGGTVTGLSIYGAALIGSFVASACYHFTPWEQVRPTLRRIDHAAIFLKIAGTYTPLVIMIGSAFSYAILGVVWGLAVIGAILKLFFWMRPGPWASGFYLALGWLSVALIWSLFALLPFAASALIVVGGLTYSAGVLFFSWDGLRFQNAIWHGFVLAASACFFAAIAMGSLSA